MVSPGLSLFSLFFISYVRIQHTNDNEYKNVLEIKKNTIMKVILNFFMFRHRQMC